MTSLLTENINRIWASLVLNELSKNNITQYYISPGMRNAPLIAAIIALSKTNKNINYHICVDERAAGYRALGFAKACGKPAAVICTSGTAMANYSPSVIEAKKSNLPLIVISADRPPELTNSDDNQTIDQTKFFNDYIQGEINLGPPTIEIPPKAVTTSLSNVVHKCFFPQMGPIHINISFREPLENTKDLTPQDYIELAKNEFACDVPSTEYADLLTVPSPSFLAKVAKIIKNSNSGIIVIGSLNSFTNTETLKEFFQKVKWPVFFDVSSSLKFEFNLNDNTIPTLDHPEVQEAFLKSPPQTIFHIGGRLTSKHYYNYLKKVPKINLITLNLNKEKEDPSHHTKLRLNADISSTLKLIIDLLPDNLEAKKLDLNFDNFTTKKIETIEHSPLSYPLISKKIIEVLPNGSHLYIGNSTVVRSFDAYFSYTFRKKFTIATNRGVSGIEGFISSACGYIDGKKTSTYLILGDISFIHDLNSLLFLESLSHSLKIILVNNFSGGIFTLLPIQREQEVLDIITSPHRLSFEKIADFSNVQYKAVTHESDLVQALNWLETSQKSAILEIFVDNNANLNLYNQLRTIKL